MDPLDARLWKPEFDQRSATAPGRRRWPRHRLRDAAGTLAWYHGYEQVICGMSMVDISNGGAAVLTDRGTLVKQPVWIGLDSGAAGPDRLRARVVATASDLSGRYIVRAQFTSSVPLASVLERHEIHQLWERYLARETRAWLAWIDHGIEFTATGHLMNISGGGAAVITDAMLPEKQPIRLTLAAETVALTPVESRLVAISTDASGLRVARLEFVTPCPMDLFELAVHGAARLG
jgi:PilZ domain